MTVGRRRTALALAVALVVGLMVTPTAASTTANAAEWGVRG